MPNQTIVSGSDHPDFGEAELSTWGRYIGDTLNGLDLTIVQAHGYTEPGKYPGELTIKQSEKELEELYPNYYFVIHSGVLTILEATPTPTAVPSPTPTVKPTPTPTEKTFADS